MGRVVAWLMIITGSVILGFNGYKFWGEINIAVRDPKAAMTISDDWQDTKIEPSLTSVENLNTASEDEVEPWLEEEIIDEISDENSQENLVEDHQQNDNKTTNNEGNEAIIQNNESNSQNSPTSTNIRKTNSNQTENSTVIRKRVAKQTEAGQAPVGSLIGQLIIPKIGAYLPVVEGTDDQSLKKGVGKYRGYGTVAPDQTGHVVLSGHRDTVFQKLGQLKNGDKLYVKYKNKIYTYQIRKTWITHAEDRTVIVPISRPVLTLTTCYPFVYKGNAPDRYIIRADLIKIKNA